MNGHVFVLREEREIELTYANSKFNLCARAVEIFFSRDRCLPLLFVHFSFSVGAFFALRILLIFLSSVDFSLFSHCLPPRFTGAPEMNSGNEKFSLLLFLVLSKVISFRRRSKSSPAFTPAKMVFPPL